jgi:ATP-binding cassette, subfamily G (WHITE), member 2, SNQ2
MKQNFGVLVIFGVSFTFCLLLFSEYNTGLSGQTPMVLFKRGSKTSAVKHEADSVISVDDLEKVISKNTSEGMREIDNFGLEVLRKRKMAVEQPMKRHTFSWHHIKYAVPIEDNEHMLLLDDISGYVAPGKFTALMGESGEVFGLIGIF